MGCISGISDTQQHQHSSKYFFKIEQQIQHRSDVYKPSFSTLFNTLRRTSDIAILQPQLSYRKQKKAYLTDTLVIDFKQENASSIKTLLNFKKIVIIGIYKNVKDSVITFIKQKTHPVKIFLIEPEEIQLFLTQYPIFAKDTWQSQKYQTKRIPIQLFDSADINESFQLKQKMRIYSHLPGKQQSFMYQTLKIQSSGILRQPQEGTENQKNYQQWLINNKNSNILIQHNPSKMTQTGMAQMLADFISKKWNKCRRQEAQIYFSKNLPRASTANLTMKPQVSTSKKTDNNSLSPTQKFAKLFLKLQKQSSVDKTQRAYDILNKLITNIYSNPQSQSFRQIKSSNKAIMQVLTSYQSGRKLLQETGFFNQGAFWVNKMQIKYLRLFKTDMELGFKHYKTEENL